MTLDELILLGKEEFINYDFKKIIFDARNISYSEDDAILNILLFKGNIYTANSDCDRLPVTLEFYKKLWGNDFYFWDDVKQNNFVEANGETMNSFVTPYKSLYKENHNPNPSSSIDKLFEEYAKLTHTIGNFIPVYAEKTGNGWASPFNGPRYRSTFDYWDLTLKDIKKILKDFECSNKSVDEFIKTVSNYNYKKYIIDSSKWILSFENWFNFITKNLLQNFLEDPKVYYDKFDDFYHNPKEFDCNPKEFWEGHFDGKVSAQSKNDLKDFLTFVNNAIKKRSKLIYEALTKNLT